MDTDSNSLNDLDVLIPDSCSITLDILQSMFYRSGKIDVYSAAGDRLESIGYGIKRDNIEASVYRLKEQIYILECILGHLGNSLEIRLQAVSVLADLLYRMQKFCRDYIK
ncbi:MAG TPA: hypothetical protein VN030_15170 [Cellvibrio sp.]|nr:hypothetical protein [Cellvibrio sp.]